MQLSTSIVNKALHAFSKLALITLAGCCLMSCKPTQHPHELRVGTIAGPETALMEVAKKVAHDRYGVNVVIIPFTDYAMPNLALNDGSIDANMFQHEPYLTAQAEARHLDIVSVGRLFMYPMGVYSNKIKHLSDLPDHASVAVPNDPSNEARALLLLANAHLISLKPGVGVNATIHDISSNLKGLVFKELDAAQLPRSLGDVTIAVINTNYAANIGLSPSRDALLVESKDAPYANVLAAKRERRADPDVLHLLAALRSAPVIAAAEKYFKGEAIVAWSNQPETGHAAH